MCGIDVTIAGLKAEVPTSLEDRLRNRGPDSLGSVDLEWRRRAGSACGLRLRLVSSLLSLRASADQASTAHQPFVDPDTGSVLCWNGEAWRLGGQTVGDGISDGLAVLAALVGRDGVLGGLRQVEGPFAVVFFDRAAGTVYFARDRLGRRSLLLSTLRNRIALCPPILRLSSVAPDHDPGCWQEVQADGIYSLCLDTLLDPAASFDQCVVRHEWVPGGQDGGLMVGIGVFNAEQAAPPLPRTPGVFFESEAVPDLRAMLEESVRIRVTNIYQPMALSVPTELDGLPAAAVAVLFSGGLDCSVLARLASDAMPASQVIDLVNVAFENPRMAKNTVAAGGDPYEHCPDRITGRNSFAELSMACPGRRWRFIAVNVSYAEALSRRSTVISLMRPHNTEMDLSIALALYFAAQGRGAVGTQQVCSAARVFVSGLGADELFGGYARHATSHRRGGLVGLLTELQLDVGRLAQRNLGRDDRVMADAGREVRYPYLDDRLVRWALELPVWQKCDFDHALGGAGCVEPAKRVLRLLARELGLEAAAVEKKRAVNFLSALSLSSALLTAGLMYQPQKKTRQLEMQIADAT